MEKTTAIETDHRIIGHGFRNLLFFLVLYIVGSPFLQPYPSLAILAHLFLSIALFAGLYAVNKQRHQRSFATMLLIPLLVLYWLGIYDVISDQSFYLSLLNK